MNTELLTVLELAEKLKVKKSWVYSRTRVKGTKAIPCLRLGKYIRFRSEEVVEWLKASEGDCDKETKIRWKER